MIWINLGKESHLAVACNVTNNGEVWIERMNGKSMRVYKGQPHEAAEVKEMIDYAVDQGVTKLDIDKQKQLTK